jgi:hypothetical protein
MKLQRAKVHGFNFSKKRYAWVPLGTKKKDFLKIQFPDITDMCEVLELDTLVIDGKLLPYMESA